MSHDHDRRFKLNINDENITFYDFALEEVKGLKAKVYYGTLTYQPHACYHCGHGWFDQGIIKHVFKSSLIVQLILNHGKMTIVSEATEL